MSKILIKFINIIIINIFSVLIVKQVMKLKLKIVTKKNIFWLVFSALPCIIFYESKYDLINTFFLFFFLAWSLKKIFDFDITIGITFTLFIMVLSVIPDLIGSAILINFVSFKTIQNNAITMFIANTYISISTYCIFKIPFIKRFTLLSIQQVQKPKHRRILIFSLVAFIAICIMYYPVYVSDVLTQNYITSTIAVFLFVILLFVYMNEIIKYDKLEMQNDILCECMQNVEAYQEQQDLKVHEYKNQLSKIAAVTKEKRVLKMLEQILQIDLTTDNYILGQLKYIPKGEIKSLIYYKLLVASKQGLNILVDVSPKIKASLFNVSEKTNTELSQLLGIYFDNAIESSLASSKKILSLEIYVLKGNLTFVIMNTYKDKIDISNMSKKGFTTKGAGHGKGLYFAEKILNTSKKIESKNEYIKNYYMQKIIIKKD